MQGQQAVSYHSCLLPLSEKLQESDERLWYQNFKLDIKKNYAQQLLRYHSKNIRGSPRHTKLDFFFPLNAGIVLFKTHGIKKYEALIHYYHYFRVLAPSINNLWSYHGLHFCGSMSFNMKVIIWRSLLPKPWCLRSFWLYYTLNKRTLTQHQLTRSNPLLWLFVGEQLQGKRGQRRVLQRSKSAPRFNCGHQQCSIIKQGYKREGKHSPRDLD